MADFLIELLFEAVDIDDEAVIDALADAGVLTVEPIGHGLVSMSAVIEHDNAVRAAVDFVADVALAVPQAKPIFANRDLVGVTDIAERVGVTREAVRHWSSGKRRAGRFPLPAGSPGGSKVWEWSAVHAWLRQNLGVWDQLDLPTHAEFAQIDAFVHIRRLADQSAQVRSATQAAAWTLIDCAPAATRIAPRREPVTPRPASEWSEPKPLNAKLVLAG